MEHSIFISVGLPIALFLIMVGMGLTLVPKDFNSVRRAPWPLGFGVASQLMVLPFIAYGLAALLDLSPTMTVGLVIIAACPGGTTSNLFVFLARGNLALSILLTVIASLLAIITLPFFVNNVVSLALSQTVVIRLPILQTMGALIVIVLVPVILGMWIRKIFPNFAIRSEKAMNLFGFLVLTGVIGAIVYEVGDGIVGMVKEAGLAVILLNLCGILYGLIVGRLCGLTHSDALTVAIELGIKNGALGLMVAMTLLGSTEIAIAPAVYSVSMFAIGMLVIIYGRRVKG